MSGKRKRVEGEENPKPLSAIAAARLRAEVAANANATTPDISHAPVLISSIPPSESPESTYREVEVEDKEELQETSRRPEHIFNFCNWGNDTKNVLSDTASELTVNLHKHSTIALIGCFDLRVQRGAININGANIGTVGRDGQRNSTHRVSVSATHPILKIRGLDGINHVQFRTCKVPMPLTSISPLFANIWNLELASAENRSFSVITRSDADPRYRYLSPEVTHEDWSRAIENCTSSPSVTMVTGSTSSGKSTFARKLMNRYLTGLGKTARPVPAVFYLDLDPTRQEYAPSGQISLLLLRDLNLGPNYTHPATLPDIESGKGNETIRAHPIPLNLAKYMEYYHSCVNDLILAYRDMYSRDTAIPLIIDAYSSLYDSNFELLNKVLARIKPHNIVHLGGAQVINTESATKLHSLQTTSLQYRSTLHELSAQPPLTTPLRTKSELRAMQMQSFFHLKTSNDKPREQENLAWASEPLSHLMPWEFCYQDTNDRVQDIVGFVVYDEPVEPASLIHGLNGSILHVVESTSFIISAPRTNFARSTKSLIPYLPKSKSSGMVEALDPRTSKLVCTAMVRGFDLERKVIQMLVPKTHDKLLYNLSPERTVLVSGCCDMPEWLYLEDVCGRGEMKSCTQEKDSTVKFPWVEEKRVAEDMGYLNTTRRVRKFQT
ncbi:hypothetical protein BKA66DRAFT_450845 [Pyrenochaeta sp. MPI-SDFR-AT-0127]|nr:hypothetical protein BKA66DRAFT_450845 [Pyrenochaeta sp. MPI-SDFR-AT-0127]